MKEKRSVGNVIRSWLGSRWTYPFIIISLITALFGDFIANEVPIVCKYEGKIYFPVLRKMGTEIGFQVYHPVLRYHTFDSNPFEWQVNPLIPYAAESLDHKNANFRSPFGRQEIASNQYRHWLGTDLLGRDVLAGMIAGVRVAFFVGCLSVIIATILGLILGMIAGYFGNKTPFSMAVSGAVIFGFGWLLIGGISILPLWLHQVPGMLSFLCSFLPACLFSYLIYKIITRFQWGQKQVAWAVDGLILQLIKWFRSIPGIFLLMALIPLFSYTGILAISIIIGLLRWPMIAQYSRAEMIKIRDLPFMQAAKGFGFTPFRILSRHALPNVIYPIIVHAAFGISTAILLESTLSFLGLGLGVDQVTWGTLLRDARSNFAAWWMAVFPGLALFITVIAFNVLGDHLLQILNPKQQKLKK